MKQSRKEVNAHAIWCGLFFVYDCAAFGDAYECVSDV